MRKFEGHVEAALDRLDNRLRSLPKPVQKQLAALPASARRLAAAMAFAILEHRKTVRITGETRPEDRELWEVLIEQDLIADWTAVDDAAS